MDFCVPPLPGEFVPGSPGNGDNGPKGGPLCNFNDDKFYDIKNPDKVKEPQIETNNISCLNEQYKKLNCYKLLTYADFKDDKTLKK